MTDAARLLLATTIVAPQSIRETDVIVTYAPVSVPMVVPQLNPTSALTLTNLGTKSTKVIVTVLNATLEMVALTACTGLSYDEQAGWQLFMLFQVDRMDDQGSMLPNQEGIDMAVSINEVGTHEIKILTCTTGAPTFVSAESDGGSVTRISNASFTFSYTHTSAFVILKRTLPPGLAVGLASGAPVAVVVSEDGGTYTFGVTLTSQPTQTVTVQVQSTAPGRVAVSPSIVTFEPSGWNTPLAVTAQGVQDFVNAGDAVVAIQFIAMSSDPEYHKITYSVDAMVEDAPSTCADSILNGDEIGVDCGGTCPACAPLPVTVLFSVTVWQTSLTTTQLDAYFQWACGFYFSSTCTHSTTGNADKGYFISARMQALPSILPSINSTTLNGLGSAVVNFERVQGSSSPYKGIVVGDTSPPYRPSLI